MVVPLVSTGWGMRGEKDGLVMTTLAWAGWGGCGEAVPSAPGVVPGPDIPCVEWFDEAAAAMAAAWWEIWCTMACMNSGGNPGKWTGVTPGYREVWFENQISRCVCLKLFRLKISKSINWCIFKEKTATTTVTNYLMLEQNSPGCPGPATFGCPVTWEPAADSPVQQNKGHKSITFTVRVQEGWCWERVVPHSSNRTGKGCSGLLLQIWYLQIIYFMIKSNIFFY